MLGSVELIMGWTDQTTHIPIQQHPLVGGTTTPYKNLIIFGGGDSALDWSVELADTVKTLSLVHRRDAFRGAPHTEKLMRKLVKDKKINLLTPYVIDSIIGDNCVSGVNLKNFDTGDIQKFEAEASAKEQENQEEYEEDDQEYYDE